MMNPESGGKMRDRKRLGATMAILTTAGLTACGAIQPETPGAPPPDDSIVACEDVTPLRAPDENYRDDPVYVGNDQPVEEVRAWAQDLPGYAGIWIDREHNGWVSVAFTQDVAERRTEVADEFSDEGVAVVEALHTEEQLADLAERVRTEGPEGAVSSLAPEPQLGVVAVELSVLSEENLQAMEEFVDEPLCVSGPEPEEVVEPGEQPTEGEQWRLLGEEQTGEVYRTGVATTESQYADLWEQAGMSGEVPALDLESEIAVWFGAVYGSSCPIRLDDVVATGRVLHAEIVVPGSPGACTEDANPHAFVVAVQREALPEGPFHVQLSAEDPPAGVPEERTVVSADLSTPGSTATADQIGTDPDLIDAADEQAPARSGDTIEPGRVWPYRLVVNEACDIRRLGRLNDVDWVTDDPTLPAAWAPLVTGGEVEVEVILTERTEAAGPTLEASAEGTTVEYRPMRSDDPATC
ncbi:hypothetical protein LQF12_03620 [Ruania suaedae]|uniref:hypothetical protein n=1 Tax=Ruania suaedae TaxID=2897774 RepID=UPI001E3BF0BD|nr:hypothetical protein [Ruania suaedae]UFU03708.1 hypothetical protein LQF12_03620 [Ruania suaedae]